MTTHTSTANFEGISRTDSQSKKSIYSVLTYPIAIFRKVESKAYVRLKLHVKSWQNRFSLFMLGPVRVFEQKNVCQNNS